MTLSWWQISLLIWGILLWIPFSFSLLFSYRESWNLQLQILVFKIDLKKWLLQEDPKPTQSKKKKKEPSKRKNNKSFRLYGKWWKSFLRKELIKPLLAFFFQLAWNSARFFSPKWKFIHLEYGAANPFDTAEMQRQLINWNVFLPVESIRFQPHWKGSYFAIEGKLTWSYFPIQALYFSIQQLLLFPTREFVKSCYFAWQIHRREKKWQKKTS